MNRPRIASFFGVVLFLVLSGLAAERSDAEDGSQKAVLVTGASTGIGRKITEVFAAEGYFVYAGARKQQDIDALNAIENVQAVKLDVTRNRTTPKKLKIRVSVVRLTRIDFCRSSPFGQLRYPD